MRTLRCRGGLSCHACRPPRHAHPTAMHTPTPFTMHAPFTMHTPLCHTCPPMDRILDIHLWKHYLSATTVADGNKNKITVLKMKNLRLTFNLKLQDPYYENCEMFLPPGRKLTHNVSWCAKAKTGPDVPKVNTPIQFRKDVSYRTEDFCDIYNMIPDRSYKIVIFLGMQTLCSWSKDKYITQKSKNSFVCS